MMGMLIHHRHGKEPSHNSTAPVGGSTGERRGWLTDLPSSHNRSLSHSAKHLEQFILPNSKKELSGNIWKPSHQWFPVPGASTWTCCLRKSCAWRSDWSRSCRRRIWSASGRSRTQSRWMNEKRTWKRNIKVQSFLKREILKFRASRKAPKVLFPKMFFPSSAPNPTSVLLGELSGFTASPQIPFFFQGGSCCCYSLCTLK